MHDCTRLRLTSDGKLRPCLHADWCYDVRELLRGGADDQAIRDLIGRALREKGRLHENHLHGGGFSDAEYWRLKAGGMIDITGKEVTVRTAKAAGSVLLGAKAFEALRRGECPKGDVLATAKVAALQAVKSTPALIPMCHPILIEAVEVEFSLDEAGKSVGVTVAVKSTGKTGVEMEALTGAAGACLTIYDMLKYTGKGMTIERIRLLEKIRGTQWRLQKGGLGPFRSPAEKGEPKQNVPAAELRADFGIVGDAHAGSGPRQVSLLAMESIAELRVQGADISPGEFAENITAEGLDLSALAVGHRLRLGDAVELEVTQLGKRCHGRCRIFEKLGDCIMPKQGVFARVVTGGRIAGRRC